MANLDIQNFQSYSSVSDTDKVLMAKNGADASITIAILRTQLSRDVKPTIIDGVWYVGVVNTGIQAIGKSPEFQTSSNGIEWRYEGETAWIPFVSYEQLKLKFSDLTPEQFQLLKLTLADLTPEELAELQQPAADAIESVQAVEKSVKDEELKRVTSENGRVTAETVRVEAENKRVTTENRRVTVETARVDEEEKRVITETARIENENARTSNEEDRATAEEKRTTAETARNDAEEERSTTENGRVTAETARVSAEEERVSEFETLKTNSEDATVAANETASHPTYVGEDYYMYKWNTATKSYDKTDIYVKGEGLDYSTMTPEEIESVKGKDGYTPVKGTDYYTAAEKTELKQEIIAEIPTPDVSGQIATHNNSMEAHVDIRTLVTNYLRDAKGYTDDKIATLIGTAPELLDTLEELAAAIQNNQSVDEALNAAIIQKQNKTDESLTTTSKTIIGALNEINAKSPIKGDTGADGRAATIGVGTVTTGSTGTNVIVTNTGTSSAAVFNFTIPRGEQGERGMIGNTWLPNVDTAGNISWNQMSGTTPITRNIRGPQGYTGDRGPQGYTGATGSPGRDGVDAVFNANQSYTLSGSNTFTAFDFITASDRRLKQNINSISIKRLIDKIQFKEFTFISDESNRKRTGFIAQEIEEIAPEYVYTNEEGKKSISMGDLHTKLISDLYEMNKELRRENKRLNNRLNVLLNILDIQIGHEDPVEPKDDIVELSGCIGLDGFKETYNSNIRKENNHGSK